MRHISYNDKGVAHSGRQNQQSTVIVGLVVEVGTPHACRVRRVTVYPSFPRRCVEAKVRRITNWDSREKSHRRRK
jgi:hypothetical protein